VKRLQKKSVTEKDKELARIVAGSPETMGVLEGQRRQTGLEVCRRMENQAKTNHTRR
jgi:hypothetical protein